MNSLQPISLWYARLVFPLSLLAMPLYMLIPKYYHELYGLSLASIASIQMAISLTEAFFDPAIGAVSDRVNRSTTVRINIIYGSVFILALAVFFLFNPWLISMHYVTASTWLSACLFLTAVTYSIVMVNYNAIVLDLPLSHAQKSALISKRELIGLAGFLLATTLPGILEMVGDKKQSYFALSSLFIGMLIFFVMRLRHYFYAANLPMAKRQNPPRKWWVIWPSLPDAGLFWMLTLLYLLHSLTISMTSTIFLFFVDHAMHAAAHASGFLGVYFLAAIFSIPFWQKMGNRFTIQAIWPWSGLVTIGCLAASFFMTSHSILWFYGICALSGWALGSDFIFPYILLATLVNNPQESGKASSSWTFVSKCSMAMGGSVSFLIMDHFSTSAQDGINPEIIRIVYAVVPCFLKASWLGLLLVYNHRTGKHPIGDNHR